MVLLRTVPSPGFPKAVTCQLERTTGEKKSEDCRLRSEQGTGNRDEIRRGMLTATILTTEKKLFTQKTSLKAGSTRWLPQPCFLHQEESLCPSRDSLSATPGSDGSQYRITPGSLLCPLTQSRTRPGLFK